MHSFGLHRGSGRNACEHTSEQDSLWQVLPESFPIPGSSAVCVNKCGKHKHLLLASLLKLPHKHRFSGQLHKLERSREVEHVV